MQILPGTRRDADEHAEAEGDPEAEKGGTGTAMAFSVMEIRALGEFGATEGAADPLISRATSQ